MPYGVTRPQWVKGKLMEAHHPAYKFVIFFKSIHKFTHLEKINRFVNIGHIKAKDYQVKFTKGASTCVMYKKQLLINIYHQVSNISCT